MEKISLIHFNFTFDLKFFNLSLQLLDKRILIKELKTCVVDVNIYTQHVFKVNIVFKFSHCSSAVIILRKHMCLHLLPIHKRQCENFDSVYFHLWSLKIIMLIQNPADCEIYSAIRFFHLKSPKAVEIHRLIKKVYAKKTYERKNS